MDHPSKIYPNKVKVISSNIAEAEIEDYEGPLVASGHESEIREKAREMGGREVLHD